MRLAAEIRFVGESEWAEVLLEDLSAGGAAVRTRQQLPVETELRLRFRLPGQSAGEERQIEISCLVVRSGSTSASARGDAFRSIAGLHFLDLHSENFERVRAFVWTLLQP